MPNWNPLQYEKFIKDRTQPSRDLAARLGLADPENAIDLGCGPGNSTKVLSDRYPGARVVGGDISEDMLAKARENYPSTEFIRIDISGDLREAGGLYDIVFSNACLQWVPDHRNLLPKLMTLLRPGGQLAVQIPMQREHPVHGMMNRLIREDKWKGIIVPRQYNNLTTEEYYDVLSDLSDDFEIWQTVYCHRMPDHDSILEWYKGAALRPYLEQLSESQAEEFMKDLLEIMKKEYPTRKNREILFRFPRLFFIVTRM